MRQLFTCCNTHVAGAIFCLRITMTVHSSSGPLPSFQRRSGPVTVLGQTYRYRRRNSDDNQSTSWPTLAEGQKDASWLLLMYTMDTPTVVVGMCFLWKPYVTRYTWHQTRTHETARNSFCLRSILTTRSRKYDDYKDSLSEIPFFVTRHKQAHMKCKQASEQSDVHMVENGLWQSLTSQQDNKGQVAEMTKKWSHVTHFGPTSHAAFFYTACFMDSSRLRITSSLRGLLRAMRFIQSFPSLAHLAIGVPLYSSVVEPNFVLSPWYVVWVPRQSPRGSASPHQKGTKSQHTWDITFVNGPGHGSPDVVRNFSASYETHLSPGETVTRPEGET